MLSVTREKRANAGSRMATLLQNEESDDFYSSAYGGFEDEADDAEYSEEDEESEGTDSDISIDENDEPVSDHEEEENKKRKRRVVTKAYKEPKKEKAEKAVKKPISRPSTSAPAVTVANIEKKRMRESTTQKSLQVKQRTQAKENLKNQEQKKKPLEKHHLTQEQLLEEAKITEMKNLKSLEMFQRLELEKKKSKVVKRAFTGPAIRFHSVTMPLIEEVETENGRKETKTVGKCSRNFITFTEESTMKEIFNFEKPKPVTKSTCIVTRLPARYFDPLTKQPSANLGAFRVIREAYYSQLEKKVDPRQPHIAKWLEWRKKMKAAKQTLKTIKAPQH
ncbi:vacuolar protein sorting-associated protein 72 homolog [Uloborus diversus]|uniref:vacuolar protein sorting-associated protein 72 homolog n=1 Tax=Uloborus diversus TaxID=327109 RepID=UPI00240970B8|nr:vacuolar protein sorting-associated protein 72 homolog [Uloborus diversus]XP_054715072.1 vacuolar protein sorting-associated protein 72 homolog [Uloborus diversus]